MTIQNRRRLTMVGRGMLIVLGAGGAGYGHDVITTKVTFDREIVRLMASHCGTCHRDGGSAFSLMTYDAARPWAKDIGEEVLQRRMPPWGAVKGFGDFRNDKALTEEQLEVIVDWEEGGAPEGEPKDIPPSIKFPADPAYTAPARQIMVSGDTKLPNAMVLDGLIAESVSDTASYQVYAELPDGGIEPLIWFLNYRPPGDGQKSTLQSFVHPFLLRNPLQLPAGTIIHGVPATDTIALLPAAASAPERLTGKLAKPSPDRK